MFAWSNNWYIRIRRQLCAEKVKTSENAKMDAGKPVLSNIVIRKVRYIMVPFMEKPTAK